MAKKRNTEDKNLLRFHREIGLNIRAIREKKGLTLEETEAAGYPSWRHLQKVEAGQPFTMSTLYRIAKALGVDPAEFFKHN